ncbi:hypothetical protein BU14_1552s0002 [Porphyra umbilicalis]|uniref:Uncharacterized protein n=1 Tax=Porphyra umbilicalis TaxID=2786 RepID=A0A1X6NLA8_PORUM|nr:hypothetical protein BU14_1552s0002 [Porphyra umbilicalis]|eukprot:OSX69394.1 hypothetical protein BU14_1552s0002 [Porphyra umbilicalis]
MGGTLMQAACSEILDTFGSPSRAPPLMSAWLPCPARYLFGCGSPFGRHWPMTPPCLLHVSTAARAAEAAALRASSGRLGQHPPPPTLAAASSAAAGCIGRRQPPLVCGRPAWNQQPAGARRDDSPWHEQTRGGGASSPVVRTARGSRWGLGPPPGRRAGRWTADRRGAGGGGRAGGGVGARSSMDWSTPPPPPPHRLACAHNHLTGPRRAPASRPLKRPPPTRRLPSLPARGSSRSSLAWGCGLAGRARRAPAAGGPGARAGGGRARWVLVTGGVRATTGCSVGGWCMVLLRRL